MRSADRVPPRPVRRNGVVYLPVRRVPWWERSVVLIDLAWALGSLACFLDREARAGLDRWYAERIAERRARRAIERWAGRRR